MTGMKIFVAAVAALLLVGGMAAAGQENVSGQFARRGRGADDAVEGHRGDHHGGGVSAPAADGQGGAGKALFEAKCQSCHELGRPLGKTKDRSGWTATVKRMQQVNRAPINDQEADEIIDYLVKVRGPASP
jgi:cytochrome c5